MSASRNKDTIEIKTSAPKEGTKVREAKIIALKRTLASGKTQKSQSKSQSRSRRTFNKEFEVEKIIGKKLRKGKVFYLVKWKGYSKKESTWEPDEYLRNCPKKITVYENKLQQANEDQDIEPSGSKPDSKSESKPPKSRKKKEKTEEDKKNQIKTKIEEGVEMTEKKPTRKPRSTPGPTHESSQQKRRSRVENDDSKQRKPRRTSNTRNKLDKLDKMRRMQLVSINDLANSAAPEKRKLSFDNHLHEDEDLTGSNGLKKVKINPKYQSNEDNSADKILTVEQRRPMWEAESNPESNDRSHMSQGHFNEDISFPKERPITHNLNFSENPVGYYRTPYTTTPMNEHLIRQGREPINSFLVNQRRFDHADLSSFYHNTGEFATSHTPNDFTKGSYTSNPRRKHKVYDLSIFDSMDNTNHSPVPNHIPLSLQHFITYGPGSNLQYGADFMKPDQPGIMQEETQEIFQSHEPISREHGNLDKIIDSLENNTPEPSINQSPVNKEGVELVFSDSFKDQEKPIEAENIKMTSNLRPDPSQSPEIHDYPQKDTNEENEGSSSPRSSSESEINTPNTKNQESLRKQSNETHSMDERVNPAESSLTQKDTFMKDFIFNRNTSFNFYNFMPPHGNTLFYDSFTLPDTRASHILSNLHLEERKEEYKVNGSFEEGDIPIKVLSAKPIMEESDLELLVVWKRRLNGVQPQKSRIMRLDLLAKGYWMLMIKYYERKMKLDSVSDFDARDLPRHYVNV